MWTYILGGDPERARVCARAVVRLRPECDGCDDDECVDCQLI